MFGLPTPINHPPRFEFQVRSTATAIYFSFDVEAQRSEQDLQAIDAHFECTEYLAAFRSRHGLVEKRDPSTGESYFPNTRRMADGSFVTLEESEFSDLANTLRTKFQSVKDAKEKRGYTAPEHHFTSYPNHFSHR